NRSNSISRRSPICRCRVAVVHSHCYVDMPKPILAYRKRDAERIERRCVRMPESVQPGTFAIDVQFLKQWFQRPTHDVVIVERRTLTSLEHESRLPVSDVSCQMLG